MGLYIIYTYFHCYLLFPLSLLFIIIVFPLLPVSFFQIVMFFLFVFFYHFFFILFSLTFWIFRMCVHPLSLPSFCQNMFPDFLHILNRRKFRSQTSDNMERWKAEQGRGREKRKIRRKKSRRERVRRQKMQMREKVGKSRNTAFFQWFVAPEGRKVGSLKRRVRSQLARGEMKNCTPLWRETHFEVKMYKTHQLRTTFGS